MQMSPVSGYSAQLNEVVREVGMVGDGNVDDRGGVFADRGGVVAARAGGGERKAERVSGAGENDDAVAGDQEEVHLCDHLLRTGGGEDGSTDASERDQERVLDEFSVLTISLFATSLFCESECFFDFYCFSFVIRKVFVVSDRAFTPFSCFNVFSVSRGTLSSIPSFSGIPPQAGVSPVFELSESKILFLMDSNSNAVVDRNVFKRSIRAVGDENANAVKKPALVNPLQEVGNAASYREK